jgi:hypothetical protein
VANTSSPSDYVTDSGTVTFSPLVTSQTITIMVNGDTRNETDETFFVNLSGQTNSTIGDNQGVGTILNDDDTVIISVSSPTITEGSSGSTMLTFLVSLNSISQQPVSVNYFTTDGTAKVGTDYTQTAGKLNFVPGETELSVQVPITPDIFKELDEFFFFNLTNSINATIGISQGTGTILDDDVLPGLSITNQTVTELDTGQFNTLTFTVSLTAPSEKIVSVDYTTEDGTGMSGAVSGLDYITNAGTIIFPPGITSQTVVIVIIGEITFEVAETFFVNLSSTPSNAVIADGQGVGTIENNDNPPTIIINDVTVKEQNAGTIDAVFTVSLSGASSQTVTVDFMTANGTAMDTSDYAATSGRVIFDPGQSSKTITVTVNGDVLNEPDEVFSVNLKDPVNATISEPQGVGTIANDDDVPLLSAIDVTANEGNDLTGPGTAIVEVRLSDISGQTIVVNFVTVDNTAKDGNGEPDPDYVATAGTLVFSPGETVKTISVSLENDELRESDETFFVDLRNATTADIDKGRAIVTITDGDTNPKLSISDTSVVEGNNGDMTDLTFTVNLSTRSAQQVMVTYTTEDNTAKADENDYMSKTAILTFEPGETTKSFSIKVIGDIIPERDENFRVNLSNPVNADIANNSGVAMGTIFNDDMPTITISDAMRTEGDAGPTDFVFFVRLSAPSLQDIQVDFDTADGDPTADTDPARVAGVNADYSRRNGKLTFAAGITEQTITVQVNGDLLNERNETFFVNLTNATAIGSPVRPIVEDGQGLGTILNDDDQPSVTMTDFTVTESNSGTVTAQFDVTLSEPSNRTVTIDYATSDVTAMVSNQDYLASSGTLTFMPGETFKSIFVTVIGDTFNEITETFTVTLSNEVNAFVPTLERTATGTITNDDGQPTITINNTSVLEDNGVAVGATFTISLSTASGLPITINFTTVDSNAVNGLDYIGRTGTITFNPRETTQQLTIDVIGDTLAEPSETFFVRLMNPTNALFPGGVSTISGTGTIENDDGKPAISSITPTIGAPVGATITINGTNMGLIRAVRFTAISGTLGLAVQPASVSATQVTAVVPLGAKTGSIQVVGDFGQDTTAFSYKILPKIDTFTPTAGTVGTSVTINGANFLNVTAVRFNGTSTTFNVVSDQQITTTVPLGATTGVISVTTADGTATSNATTGKFTIQPKIDAFSPTSGAGGTVVTITGSGFTGVTGVKFNGVTATPTFVNDQTVRATVPGTATTGRITLTTPGGTATSPTDFVLAPKVTTFTPTSGAARATISINGTNLSSVNQVFFNGPAGTTPVAGTVLSTTNIQARVMIPDNAATGTITVVSPAGSSTTATNFKVLPRIEATGGITPLTAPRGASVTINGTGLRLSTGTAPNPTVRFGTVTAVVTSATPRQVVAIVPATATGTVKIAVVTTDGTATSTESFVVQVGGVITGFTPTSGAVGSAVTLSGTNLNNVTDVQFNGISAEFTIVSATSIRAIVPEGTSSGKISVTSPFGGSGGISSPSTTTSTAVFKVLPRITSFSPATFKANDSVTITGMNFGNLVSVKFGTVLGTVVSASNNQIVVTVPATAPLTGKITVTTSEGSGASVDSFLLVKPPTVSSFSPTSAKVGVLVTINGSNLNSVTDVRFTAAGGGQVSAGPITVVSATSIRVTVPVGAATGKITVQNLAGTFTSAGSFTVLP